MALASEIPELLAYIESRSKYIKENQKLYTAIEGNLGELVLGALSQTLSPATFAVASQRISPVNILRKVADKLATIYQQNPVRLVQDGSEADADLLSWYEKSFRMNEIMNSVNEYYVVSKVAAVMPFVHKGIPRLRALQASKFVVYSNDPVDPTHVTHFITIQGKTKDSYGQDAIKYEAWTDSEYLIFNSKGEILRSEMNYLGNPEGLNPFGKIPAVYVNRSSSELTPDVDGDMLRMTMLVPLFLTDLNVGAMFTVWPIMWTRDVNIKDFAYSPQTTIQMFTDPTVMQKPEIGTIEPKMDIPNQLMLLQSQLSVWLSTKNIRPASVGELTVENFASGVSKMIDEGDTVEERKRQVELFKNVEEKLWDLIINNMQPVWIRSGMVENRAMFPLGSKVETDFPMQIAFTTRGQVVSDLKNEVDAKFLTRRMAIKRLNPSWNDSQIDELMAEIDAEAGSSVSVNVTMPAEPEEVSAEERDDDEADDTSDEANG
jgi:hypothetical protein